MTPAPCFALEVVVPEELCPGLREALGTCTQEWPHFRYQRMVGSGLQYEVPNPPGTSCVTLSKSLDLCEIPFFLGERGLGTPRDVVRIQYCLYIH
jgi:hypothetical protein